MISIDRRLRPIAGVVAAAVALGGCAIQSDKPEDFSVARAVESIHAEADALRRAQVAADPTPTSPDGSPSDAPPRSTDVPGPESSEARTISPEPSSEDRTPGPEPSAPTQSFSDFPMAVTLGSNCVIAGGQMTITVETSRETGVGYLAYYAEGTNGAPAPYGEGYGGNDGGMTDTDGRYQSTWTVSPQTPTGPAHVKVVAGRGQNEYSSTTVPFEVVDPTTGCP